MEMIAEARCFEGWQRTYRHVSSACAGEMQFAVFQPPQPGPRPVLYWLSGLTCTEQNFVIKSGVQRYAAEHGMVIVAPDTSPRQAQIAGEDEDWDFGTGAGFYVNATQPPWSQAYRMYDYVTDELPALVESEFSIDGRRRGIFGHSMGGHGALIIALKNPHRYRSCSAFAPIVAPTQVPWGIKAFLGYLGEDRSAWKQWDATELVRSGAKLSQQILIDQGLTDDFLSEQLQPEQFERACAEHGQALKLNRRQGYDHSYYFIASFIGDHLAHHAQILADDPSAPHRE